MSPLGDRKVYPDLSTTNVNAVATLFCLIGVILVFKVNEGESTRSASLCVIDDLNVFNRTVLGEDLLQVALLRVDGETKDAQASTFRGVLAIANVTTARGHRRTGALRSLRVGRVSRTAAVLLPGAGAAARAASTRWSGAVPTRVAPTP